MLNCRLSFQTLLLTVLTMELIKSLTEKYLPNYTEPSRVAIWNEAKQHQSIQIAP